MTRRLRAEGLHLAVLGAIVVLGAVLRIAGVFEPMRYDEAFTFTHYISKPWEVALEDFTTTNNHLLNTALAHGAWILFGNDPWALRLPALLAGIALVPATYFAARLIFDRDAGLVAAAIVAASAPLIQYSINSRGYSLGVLFVTTALAFGAWGLRGGRWPAWAGFAASCALAAYAIPSMVIGLAMVIGWLGLSALVPNGIGVLREDVRVLRGRAGTGAQPGAQRAALLRARGLPLAWLAAALGAGAFAAWLAYRPTFGQSGWDDAQALAGTGERVIGAPRKEGGGGGDSRTDSLVERVFEWFTDEIPLPALVVILVALVAGTLLHRRLGGRGVPLVLPIAVVIAGTVVVGGVSPLVRTWSFLVPLLAVVAGGALAAGARATAARLERPPELAGAVTAVLVAAVLAGGYLAAGDEPFLIDPPASETDLPYYAGENFPGQFVHGSGFAIATQYHFERVGHQGFRFGGFSPEEYISGRALLVTHRTEAKTPAELAESFGAQVTGEPRRIKRWKWATLWEVPISRPG